MSRHFKKVKDILFYPKNETNEIINIINSFKGEAGFAIYNPECLGIMNSTKDLFKNTLALKEVLNKKQIDTIVDAIINSNVKYVVFSSITFGWKGIAEKLKEKNNVIKIKFLWHGSHAMFVERDESYFLYSILELMDRGIVDSIGFFKESMANFYKEKGYNSFFVTNNVKDIKVTNHNAFNKEDGKVYIGSYAAGDRWGKNTANQLSAASMIENLVLDIIPVTPLISEFCETLNITINDKKLGYLQRQDLLNRIALNDVNLYVTFTECSPVIPLESLELGVPCITGNNHSYFKNSKLEEYLVVKSEDNIDEIYSKIKYAINNKEEIIKLYKDWKKEYDVYAEELLCNFIND
ncbi:MAG: hypothetical protein IJ094_01245 [Bacilli bacterium]|nr:hypothetical protein [Bacilli bacterium]